MHYSPAEENLGCLYCRHSIELDKTAAEIEENDFAYWKDRADENAEQELIETAEIKCRQCGAVTSLPPNISSAQCVFCTTPLILNEASIKRFWQPEYLLPFKITDKESNSQFKKWLGKKWFLPNSLKKNGAHAADFQGVYLPFWTYDAQTHTEYRGRQGKYRTKHYTDNKGRTFSRAEINWYRKQGTVFVEFDDVIVPASESLPQDIASDLTNWDMDNCVAYRKEFLAGFTTEIYRNDFRKSFEIARNEMKRSIEVAVRHDIGGDRQRIDSMQTHYEEVKFKLLLLPVWISAFKFNNKVYQFVVNGRTGQVIGNYPISIGKIISTVLLVVAILFVLFLIIGA